MIADPPSEFYSEQECEPQCREHDLLVLALDEGLATELLDYLSELNLSHDRPDLVMFLLNSYVFVNLLHPLEPKLLPLALVL